MIRARAQLTEATEALDQALGEGDEAIAVVRGILATSPDAPVGALTALRQAKRIGPRVVRWKLPSLAGLPVKVCR